MTYPDKITPASQSFTIHPALRPASDPRIPHPSWRQTITGSDQGAGRIASAGDFWARLGI